MPPELETFLRLRQAVQAGYFAWRITNNVLTGITDPSDNLKGLADARRSFGLQAWPVRGPAARMIG